MSNYEAPIEQLRDLLPDLGELRSALGVRGADAVDVGVEGVIAVARRANQQSESVSGCASLKDGDSYSTGRVALARGGLKVDRGE